MPRPWRMREASLSASQPLGVLLLQLTGQHAVLVGHLLLGVQGLLLLADVIQALVAHDDGVHDVVLVIGVLVLLQHRHADVGQQGHLAGGGVQLSGEDLQESGFTRAVGADNAVAVAPGELQVHVGKQGGPAILQAQVGDSDHGTLLLYVYVKIFQLNNRAYLTITFKKKTGGFSGKSGEISVEKLIFLPICTGGAEKFHAPAAREGHTGSFCLKYE